MDIKIPIPMTITKIVKTIRGVGARSPEGSGEGEAELVEVVVALGLVGAAGIGPRSATPLAAVV